MVASTWLKGALSPVCWTGTCAYSACSDRSFDVSLHATDQVAGLTLALMLCA
jgi:hypothetical protein